MGQSNFVDMGLESGVTYYYRVVAVDTAGNAYVTGQLLPVDGGRTLSI